MTASAEAAAAPIGRASWRAGRFWLILAALIVLGGGLVAAIGAATPTSSKPLDPTSPAAPGSQALARLLEQRGTAVTTTTRPSVALGTPASTTVLIAFPDALGTDQLRQLAQSGHRLVVLDPDLAALSALTDRYQRNGAAPTGSTPPDCAWPGATAAGPIEFPAGTSAFVGPGACYGGAVAVTDQLALLGSGDLLRNDQLANGNNAALGLNAISADGAATSVTWLLPGIEDTGAGSPSVWQLFPPWAQRSFWWLLVVGVLTTLWRGRRLGPVVVEPLPVVVRSVEVVEGHGRLYRRAGSRERAAAVLRAATVARLASALGLDRRASANEVIEVAAQRTAAADRRLPTADLLLGEDPADDESLVRLGQNLTTLEADLRLAQAEPIRPAP